MEDPTSTLYQTFIWDRRRVSKTKELTPQPEVSSLNTIRRKPGAVSLLKCSRSHWSQTVPCVTLSIESTSKPLLNSFKKWDPRGAEELLSITEQGKSWSRWDPYEVNLLFVFTNYYLLLGRISVRRQKGERNTYFFLHQIWIFLHTCSYLENVGPFSYLPFFRQFLEISSQYTWSQNWQRQHLLCLESSFLGNFNVHSRPKTSSTDNLKDFLQFGS